MQKRIFLVHGWEGTPEKDWLPWLKKELEKRDFAVFVPAMPETMHPKTAAWLAHLTKVVGSPDKNCYFVGHSIGCQTILRYLETLPPQVKVGGAVFVAGWFTLMNLDEDEKPIAKPWLEAPIDFNKVKQHTKQFVAIFSDNDNVVPIENKRIFEEKLAATTIVEQGRGHFSGDDGINELPVALESVLKLAKD